MDQKYKQTEIQIAAWCHEENKASGRIAGCILIGSQARTEMPADAWSDMDLMVLVQDPSVWVNESGWLERFGSPVCIFLEVIEFHFMDWNWYVKRVLYDDNRDIDFSILPYDRLDEVLKVNLDFIEKGWKVLFDASPGRLESKITALLANTQAEQSPSFTQAQVSDLIHNLLFHIIWAFKKIKRGELWTAVGCINDYMRGLLLRLIEIHNASFTRKTSLINHDGRFLEQRTDPKIINQLKFCFTRYDSAEAVDTLGFLIEMIQSISAEIYTASGYEFDEAPFAQIRRLYSEMKGANDLG